MGRKKTITKLSEVYAVNSFVETSFLDLQFSRINYFANLTMLAIFTLYFLGTLNMADKIFAFIISGKVMGTSYVMSFSDVCLLSAAIVATLLAKSTYNYLKIAKNRNKIRLQIKEANPLSLTVRVTA